MLFTNSKATADSTALLVSDIDWKRSVASLEGGTETAGKAVRLYLEYHGIEQASLACAEPFEDINGIDDRLADQIREMLRENASRVDAIREQYPDFYSWKTGAVV